MSKFVHERTNKLNWSWLEKEPVGFSVVLHEGYAAARNMAAYYHRKIKQQKLSNGDYKITILV